MKNLSLLLLMLLVSIGTSAQRVSHEFRNASLSQVLSVLSNESKSYRISFMYDKLENLKVTVRFSHLTIPEAIDRVTEDQPVKVKKKRDIITIQYKKKVQPLYIGGTVYDSRTHKQLPGASVTLMRPDSTIIGTTEARVFWMDRGQQGYRADYGFEIPRRPQSLLIKATYVGYKPTIMPYTIGQLARRQYSLELPPLYLKVERNTLDEVQVVASKVMFYHKGDTVVYNADAFQLSEGSMLDALIRQLPGVELKDDGRIYLNGRFVDRLLLNGKDFFKGNKQVLLDNLPAYTVKDIKVYDKLSDEAAFLGRREKHDLSYVMDVQLKHQYNIGWMTNIEAGAGSAHKYLARLFALRFTDHSQVGVYANMNNLNDNRKPGQQTTWTPSKLMQGENREVLAGIDYNVEARDEEWKLGGSMEVAHSNSRLITNTARTNFLPTGNTLDRMEQAERSRTWKLNTSHSMQRQWKKVQIDIRPSFNYRKFDNTQSYSSTAMGDTLLNAYMSRGMVRGHIADFGVESEAVYKLKNSTGNISLESSLNMSVNHQEQLNTYDLRYGQAPSGRQYANQYYRDHPHHALDYEGSLSYWTPLSPTLSLRNMYTFAYKTSRRQRGLYLLERLDTARYKSLGDLPSVVDYERVMDRGNSYDSHFHQASHTLHPLLTWSPHVPDGSLSVALFIPMTYEHQRLHYMRGTTDTTLVRNRWLAGTGNSFVDWRNKDDSKHLFFCYRVNPTTPDLTYSVDISDTTDPLNIQQGNGNLRTTWQHEFLLSYGVHNAKRQSMIGFDAQANIWHNKVSMGYGYNPKTGIRTYRPANVNGNWDGSLTVAFMTPLDKARRLTLTLVPTLGYIKNVDMIGSAASSTAAMQRSTVRNLYQKNTLKLKYGWGENAVTLFGDTKWQHITGDHADFARFNATDYSYGATALLALPWKVKLSTDLTMFSRRGYHDTQLNTDELVWNAQLSRSFFKSRIVAILDAYDILGKLSNVTRTINAQGRTESYTNVQPRYLLLHIAYRLSIQPKNVK